MVFQSGAMRHHGSPYVHKLCKLLQQLLQFTLQAQADNEKQCVTRILATSITDDQTNQISQLYKLSCSHDHRRPQPCTAVSRATDLLATRPLLVLLQSKLATEHRLAYPHCLQLAECLHMWRVLLQQHDAVIDHIHTAVYGIKHVAPAAAAVAATADGGGVV